MKIRIILRVLGLSVVNPSKSHAWIKQLVTRGQPWDESNFAPVVNDS